MAKTHKNNYLVNKNNKNINKIGGGSSKKTRSRTSNSSSQYIPKYEIVNRPTSASLVVYLDKNQSVIDRYGYMNYFDSSIKMESKMVKGVKGVFKFITGGDAFENIYPLNAQ
jgi:hypothetical protein